MYQRVYPRKLKDLFMDIQEASISYHLLGMVKVVDGTKSAMDPFM